jgi:two-component system sensor histidine kinase/response regulator
VKEPIRILHLEDSMEDGELLQHILKKGNILFDIKQVVTKSDFLSGLTDFHPHIILADYMLPLFNGLEALALTREKNKYIPFIFVTGTMGEDLAVISLKQGANDYILKDRINRLPQAITRALEEAVQLEKVRTTKKALLTSEVRYRNLVETSIDCIWQIDKNWIFEYVSPRSKDIFGYFPDEMIGKNLFSFCFETELPGEVILLKKSFERKESVRLREMKSSRKDGSFVVCETSAMPFYDKEGTFLGYDGNSRDITQKVEAEKHIRELALAVEQSTESIVITDLDGSMTYVNDSFLHITGYDRDEILGLNPRILKSGETPDAIYEDLWNKLTTGEVWTGEFINKRKDGSLLNESAIISPLRKPDGSITGYVGVKEVITEKKQLSQDLEKQRQNLELLVQDRTEQLKIALENANTSIKAKERFLANMSHEIRTPLNAILVLLHLLKGTELNSDQKGKIEKIQYSSNHLLSLINDLLDSSKIASSKLILESIPINISTICEHVKSMLLPKAEEKSLVLDFKIDEFPENILGDPTRLTQIMLNLLNNAIKFTEQGTIHLRVKVVEITESFVHFCFEIEDEGIGIQEKDISRLFSPFEQLDSSTTRDFGGTGLGLAISRQLAQMMGGECGAYSSIGQGSTFWFTASFKRDLRSDSHFEAAEMEDLIDDNLYLERFSGKEILLVDDDIINQQVETELLEEYGFLVTVAGNGLKALNQMKKKNPFEIILMDMQMPQMDGLEATSRIRKLSSGKNIPIIAMTGNASHEDRVRCINAGMNDVLLKPIDPDTLFQTLYQWLDEAPGKGTKSIIKTEKVDETDFPLKESTLTLILSSFDGIDFDQISKIFGSDLNHYIELIGSLRKKYENIPALVNQKVRAGDLTGACEDIHRMSGTAGTLGLKKIFEIARLIEPMLLEEKIDKDHILSLLDSLKEPFRQLKDLLISIEQVEVILPYKKINKIELQTIFDQLEMFLTNNDTACIQFFEENKKILQQNYPDLTFKLKRQIEDFEYETALKTIGELKKIISVDSKIDKKTILFVDDEPLIRILGEKLLEKMDYNAILAQNGLEAVEIFKEKHAEIDLILMDMIMPIMNGEKAFHKLKEIDSRCPIIITSAYTDKVNMKELYDSGLSGFIQKPFTISHLSELLRKILTD